jgi:hypothetical protein
MFWIEFCDKRNLLGFFNSSHLGTMVGLNSFLEFYVTIEVGSEAAWLVIFAKKGLKAMNVQMNLVASVGGRFSGFIFANHVNAKVPLRNQDHLVLKFLNGNF